MTQALRTDEQLVIHQNKAQEYHSKIEEAKKSIVFHTAQVEKSEKLMVILQQISEANQKIIVGYTYLTARPDEERQRILKYDIEVLEGLKQQYENMTQETQQCH